MLYTHNGIFFSHEKEGDLSICSSMDGTLEHYAKRDKSDRERQVLYDITYIWNLKAKLIKIESKIVVTWGWGVVIGQILFKGTNMQSVVNKL